MAASEPTPHLTPPLDWGARQKLGRVRRLFVGGCLLASAWACTGPLLLGFEDVDTCSLERVPRSSDDRNLRGATFWRDGQEVAARDVLKDAFEALDGTGSFEWTVSSGRVANLNQFIRVESPPKDGATGGGSSQSTTQVVLINDFDVVQLNGGADVRRFPLSVDLNATTNLLQQRPLLCPVDSGSDAPTNRQSFASVAMEPSQCHGSLYAVPVGIHRINTLLFSRVALERAKVELAADGGDLSHARTLRALEKIRCYPLTDPVTGAPTSSDCEASDLATRRPFASPADFRNVLTDLRPLFPSGPMAMASRESWPLNFFALEFLMASRPKGLYEAVWYGRAPADSGLGESAESENGLGGACTVGTDGDGAARAIGEGDVPRLREELDSWIDEFISFFRVSGTPLVRPTAVWRDAIHAVQAGDALLTPMGDFGIMEGENRDDLIAIPFPASDLWADEPFVYTPDSFAFPQREGDNGYAVRRFIADVLGNGETMLTFANKKGAIPPRSDLSIGRLALPHQREAYARLKDWSDGRSAAGCDDSTRAAERCRAEWQLCLDRHDCPADACEARSCEALCESDEAECNSHKGCTPGKPILGCEDAQEACDKTLVLCEKERTESGHVRMMLAVSGLAPPPGDPCVDALSEYLAVLAGGAFRLGVDYRRTPLPNCLPGYQRSASPQEGYDVCAPEVSAATGNDGSRGEGAAAAPADLARAALTELLVGLAQSPYQAQCDTVTPP
jgi:hypothetical protein